MVRPTFLRKSRNSMSSSTLRLSSRRTCQENHSNPRQYMKTGVPRRRLLQTMWYIPSWNYAEVVFCYHTFHFQTFLQLRTRICYTIRAVGCIHYTRSAYELTLLRPARTWAQHQSWAAKLTSGLWYNVNLPSLALACAVCLSDAAPCCPGWRMAATCPAQNKLLLMCKRESNALCV